MRRDPWRDFCPDFSDFMTRLSRLKLSARLCNLGLNPDAARPLTRFLSRLSRSYDKTFQNQALGANLHFLGLKLEAEQPLVRLMSRHSRLKLLARICKLGLNQDAALPLARLLARFSRLYVQTFQTQTLGAILQFGSKSRCGATIGVTHVQTFQTLCLDFADSNARRDSAIWI